VTRFTIATLLFFTVAGRASAQSDPDSIHARNDCRLAVQIVLEGEPANKRDWAIGLGPSCGAEFGKAVAGRLRLESHGQYSDEIGRIADRTFGIKDATLLEAVLEVANDPSAGLEFRVSALRTAFWQVSPSRRWGPLDAFISGRVYDGSFSCPSSPLTDSEPTVGEPIAASQVIRAMNLGDSISRDQHAPADVRRMAACLWATARRSTQS